MYNIFVVLFRNNKKVNESQMEDKKRIPFPHMIYFDDGKTNVLCMKIAKMFGLTDRVLLFVLCGGYEITYFISATKKPIEMSSGLFIHQELEEQESPHIEPLIL